MKIKRTKGISTYVDDFGTSLSIKCEKKEGELFKSVADNIFRLKGNLNVFHKAVKEGKMFVSDTDGTLLEGIYANNLEEAINICRSYNALSISEGNGPYNVWKYSGEKIYVVVRHCGGDTYSNLEISGCIFNPYMFPNKTEEIRHILSSVLESNLNTIKTFIGHDCDLKMTAVWE